MFVQFKEGDKILNKKTNEVGEVVSVGQSFCGVQFNHKSEVELISKMELTIVDDDKVDDKGKSEGVFREQEAVSEFHKAFKYSQSDTPIVLSADDVFKRIVFIQEELIELLAASVDGLEEFHEYINKLEDKQLEAENKETLKIVDRAVNTIQDSVEAHEEYRIQRITDQADALVDILVFTYGSGDMAGVDLLPLFKIVMEANMSKLDDNGEPIYNEFGKIQKSDNFTPPEPRLFEEIKRQINE